MDNIVTLNQLLNVSKDISINAEQNKEHNELLDEIICDKYDVLDCKKKLRDLFSSFKSARYLYDFPIEDALNITSNIDPTKVSFGQHSNVSQLENAVQHYVDEQILTTYVYHSIMKVSYKLTGDEATYLINTFLAHKSEEDIAEIIGISKTYLQKIKKSCIVKMWIDLKKYCKEDD